MTEPVRIVIEDDIVAGCFVVDSTLWVSIIAVDVTGCTALERFLTNDCRRTAENIRRSCREDCCLDVVIDHGVTPVVVDNINVEESFSIKATWVEVIDSFDRWIVKIERLDVANDVVVDCLLIPRMITQCCRNSIDGVVEEVGRDGSRLFFTRSEVDKVEVALKRLWVREVSSVLLVDGNVVNCVSVTTTPERLVVVCN